jgi:hypothetical protein
VKRATKENQNHKLRHKGIYSPEARQLARELVIAGCTQEYVGNVIQQVCGAAGVTVDKRMSRRTVSRAVAEGHVAAQMQIAHEITQSGGFTASGDGTSNKNVNYDSRFVHINNVDGTHKSRFLGLHSSADQSSEQQVNDWIEIISDILNVYEKSPLAQRSGNFMRLVEVLQLLKGMNSDHCGKEKKTAHGMEDKKHTASLELLGEKQMSKDLEAASAAFTTVKTEMIRAAGGSDAWAALSQNEQAEQTAIMTKKVIISMGENSYSGLSEQERRELDFFIWVGCGCHKDLNTVKGGNSVMMAWWAENDIPGPILLANKDNAAVLANKAATSDTVTPVEQRALDVTTRGGVKAASIAGAIFNHKDDKKGQQDVYLFGLRRLESH